MSRHTISTDGKWRKRGTYNREREREEILTRQKLEDKWNKRKTERGLRRN